MNNHPLWGTWRGIKTRCRNSNHVAFARYGGRGIDMCDDWFNSLKSFSEAVGPRPSAAHTIDRIDPNMGYVPGNVRWATKLEQSRNRRDNIVWSWGGETLTLPEWCEVLELPYSCLNHRMRKRNSLFLERKFKWKS